MNSSTALNYPMLLSLKDGSALRNQENRKKEKDTSLENALCYRLAPNVKLCDIKGTDLRLMKIVEVSVPMKTQKNASYNVLIHAT